MRLVAKIIITVLLLVGLLLTTVATLLHTRFAEPLISHSLNYFTDYQISAKKISYDIRSPWHLILEQPSIKHNQQVLLNADKIQLWLSPQSLNHHDIILNSVVIDNLKLNKHPNLFDQLPTIKIKRLALDHLNIITPEYQLKQAQLQLDNWQTPTANQRWWQQFNGYFQLRASGFNWHNTQFSNVLVSGDKQKNNWQFDGFSWQWNQANFSGQAHYDQQQKQATIDQFTIANLKLQDPQQLESLQALVAPLQDVMIKRLDILDTSIELPQWSADDINLSLKNWQWPTHYWQQENSDLSFSASNAKWHETVFEHPLGELQFTPNKILVEGLSTQLMSGFVRLNGWLSPTAITLNNFNATGIKWFLPDNWLQTWQTVSNTFTDVMIDKLDINNSQLTAAHSTLPFQLAGINIEANNATLKKQGKWGLWYGDLSANIDFASVNQIVMTNAITEMTSHNGNWKLNRLVLPFKDGMLNAQGNIELNKKGKPWQLAINNDNIPATIFYRWLRLPLPVNGFVDGSMAVNGLADNLDYSLTGRLELAFRQLHLANVSPSQLFDNWKKPSLMDIHFAPAATTPQMDNFLALDASNIIIQADRGRLSMHPWLADGNGLNIRLQGKGDLTTPKKHNLKLMLTQGCQQLEHLWHNNQSQLSVSSSCTGNIK